MAIIASDKAGPKILCPPDFQNAVCVDVFDRGMLTSELYHKTQHKVSIHFLLEELIPVDHWYHPHTKQTIEVPPEIAGKPFGTQKWFTLSLDERSALRPFLEKWRGQEFTQAELMGFDLETLIGAPCTLQIQHTNRNGVWRDTIAGIGRKMKDATVLDVPHDYVRLKDRPENQAQGEAHEDADHGTVDPDDSLPF